MSKDYDTILLECEEAMQKVVDHLSQEYVGITAGRANTNMVANIKFDYYGAPTPISQAGQVNTPDASTITIKPHDPSQVKTISKAIVDANVGLSPSDDGKVIICKIPPMTEENRSKIAKQVKEISEDSKVAIRNARHDAMKSGEASHKDSILTEDDHHALKDDIQKKTNEYNKKIEDLLKAKTDEVMKV